MRAILGTTLGVAALLASLAPGALSEPGAAASSGTTVQGVVLRAPAEASRATQMDRYREHRVKGSEDAVDPAECNCDPGRYAVVSLTGDHLPPIRLPVQPPTMAQKDRMFEPSVLAVPVGATVKFPNLDPFFHNVFSYSKSKRFDLGRYPAGQSQSVVFDKPGVISVFCEIHYSMRAYVHVLDTPYFAVTDDTKHFSIPGVLPGAYVLHVWQENLPEIRRAITVGNEPLDLQIQ
ncbi:MAG: hypothetical protein U0167_11335 [bacterium]